MDDPFLVGQGVGAAVVFAIVAFVVARKLCGPAGASELARLERIAGVGVLEQQEGRLGLLVRDWLPWVAGVMAALTAFVVVFVGNAARPPAPESLEPFTADQLPQLVAGFVHGCQNTCVGAGVTDAACSAYCTCTLNALREGQPSDQAFIDWFSHIRYYPDPGRADVQAAEKLCPAPSPQ